MPPYIGKKQAELAQKLAEHAEEVGRIELEKLWAGLNERTETRAERTELDKRAQQVEPQTEETP